ncbi:MAG: bifunctional hydroxymethylpyrimidine kinase/phosphomethylpyrimidine kinase [Chthoniobacterales bacterium]
MSAQIPVALTIAGSDSSAGAGVQADLKTFSALGVYGLTAITCVVAETPGKVQRIAPVETAMVLAQVELLLEQFPVRAIKTGMLYSAEIVARVAAVLRQTSAPLVVDPVMVATSGDLLLQKEAIAIYERELFPLADVITPNLDEAATLLGEPIHDLGEMRSAGQRLCERYGVPVLVKGGHLGGTSAIDLLCTRAGVAEFAAPFTHGVQTHGTGCTYSAGIAAGLAADLPLEAAVQRAKEFVSRAIERHFSWEKPEHAPLHALNHSACAPPSLPA